jgi:ABC-type nickel/cobalt efflux system permease component RcnA
MNKSIGIIAVTAATILLLTATGMTQGVFAHSSHHHHHSHNHNHHHHHGHGHGHGSNNNNNNSQSLAQANSCGNGSGASNVNCQNLGSQIQGSGNAVNVIGQQG